MGRGTKKRRRARTRSSRKRGRRSRRSRGWWRRRGEISGAG